MLRQALILPSPTLPLQQPLVQARLRAWQQAALRLLRQLWVGQLQVGQRPTIFNTKPPQEVLGRLRQVQLIAKQLRV